MLLLSLLLLLHTHTHAYYAYAYTLPVCSLFCTPLFQTNLTSFRLHALLSHGIACAVYLSICFDQFNNNKQIVIWINHKIEIRVDFVYFYHAFKLKKPKLNDSDGAAHTTNTFNRNTIHTNNKQFFPFITTSFSSYKVRIISSIASKLN